MVILLFYQFFRKIQNIILNKIETIKSVNIWCHTLSLVPMKLSKPICDICNLSTYNPIGAHIANYVTDYDGHIVLEYAIQNQKYDICKLLLDDLKILKQHGIFIKAVRTNNNEIIQLISRYIQDRDGYDEIDEECNTPLCYAAFFGNLDLCQFLVWDNDCRIDGYKTEEECVFGSTPLVNAVLAGHYKVVKFLLKNNANPSLWAYSEDDSSHEPTTPLHVALQRNDFKMFRLLLMFGAHPFAVYSIESDMHHIKEYYPSVVQLIIKTLGYTMRYLKLIKTHTNVITHDQYIMIRNTFRTYSQSKAWMCPHSGQIYILSYV